MVKIRKPKRMYDINKLEEEKIPLFDKPNPRQSKNINPPANPSSPSSRLTELYIPTNHMKKNNVKITGVILKVDI